MQSDAEKNGSVLKLLEVLVKVLREEHLVKMVSKAYINADFGKLKLMLGLSELNDKEAREFMIKKGMRMNGNFVNPEIGEEESGKKRFELSEERMGQIT